MASQHKFVNKLRFDLGVEGIKKHSEEIMAKTKKVLDEVVAIPLGEHTFENTIKRIADQEAEHSIASAICTFPSSVSDNKAIRDAAVEAEQALSQFNIDTYMRLDVYRAIIAYTAENAEKLQSLDAQDRRLVTKLLLDFQRNGLALSEEKQAKVKEIKKRVADLCIKFQNNVNEDKSQLYLTKEELAGVPDAVLAGLAKENKDGKEVYVVTMKYPDVIPALKFSEVEETRKKLDLCFNSRCKIENTPILEEIVALRHQLSQVLGYATHSHNILEIRMAKTPEAVTEFYKSLRPKLDKLASSELEQMLALKKEKTGASFDGKINSWDFTYYDRLIREKQYSVNEQDIQEYFPMQTVVDGTFDVYQTLLGLRFEKLENEPVWHPEVLSYKVYDSASGEFVGQFYMDMFPREGKYGHAAAFPLQEACFTADGAWQHPISAMVCNFTKPLPDKPSILKHSEVETFFHEFGHIMHGICSKETKYSRFAGTNTEQDFVECPSQMLENWCWKKEILTKISKHYVKGTPLPDELLSKMIASKNANSGLLNLRQVFFGYFDQTIHTSEKVNVQEVYNKLRQEITHTYPQEGSNGAASFGHLVGGYDASYYGYLWSKVFAADLFSQFEENILSPELGKKYRDLILARGGSKDGADMLRDFLGRDPTIEPFFKEIGL